MIYLMAVTSHPAVAARKHLFSDTTIYTKVDMPAQFPGGEEK
jgi:hypothetical protein